MVAACLALALNSSTDGLVSLKGWKYDARFWKVNDGVVIGETHPSFEDKDKSELTHNTFFVSPFKVKDFELTCLYRITPLNKTGFANSGIQYRSQMFGTGPEGPQVRGYQADIDAQNQYTGSLYEEAGYRETLSGQGQQVVWTTQGKQVVKTWPVKDVLNKTEDWTSMHVVAKGNRVDHYVSGKLVTSLEDRHPKAGRAGIVAFQLHVGGPMRVEFREIRIRRF
ncbi:MAG: DUF1080 domain-containing protein [bacterium]